MKEIGGYLSFEENFGREFHQALRFNLSRNCLEYLIIKKNIRRIYLPYYLCLSIEEVLLRNKVDIHYYHIDKAFSPIMDIVDLKDNEFLYIVNYFGQITNDYIEYLKNKYRNVIVDNTQSFFQIPVKGVHTIYNCRKYFGVPDGAYLYTDVLLDKEIEKAHSSNRMKHILGRYEENASKYYLDYCNIEDSFGKANIELMSNLTLNLLKGIDYDRIKKRRIDNSQFLDDHLKMNKKILCQYPCTYMYPLLIENGVNIKKKLINDKIYIPTLWPDLDKYPLNEFEKDIYLTLICIPIDQRYNLDDMDYIVKKIKEYREGV